MAEVKIPSPELIDATRDLIKQELAKRPNLSNNQRRQRPAFNQLGRFLGAQITAVFGSDQPTYSAQGIELPGITVENQTPFWRVLSSSQTIVAGEVGDECILFKEADNNNWQLGIVHETQGTADCQAVAGSRNNMAYQLITATQDVEVTADWIDADASAGAVVLTLSEDEVGKRFTVAKIDVTANPVTINNTVNGSASLVITNQYDAPTVAYNGTEWRII